MAEYVLDQSGDPTEPQRLALLEKCWDPWSTASLARLGVAAGWRCLDVGAGGGSIARWLAERVGSNGSVLAVDLDLTLLEPLVTPTLSVRRLDVRHEELPKGADLVHSRFLLQHLPECEIVLHRMIGALRPGGWLVITDTDFRSIRFSEPDAAFDRIVSSFAVATRAAGWNPHIGPSLPSMFESADLVDVSAESIQTYTRGGHGVVLAATYRRIRDRLVEHGARSEDVDSVADRMARSTVGVYGPTASTVWGRRKPVEAAN